VHDSHHVLLFVAIEVFQWLQLAALKAEPAQHCLTICCPHRERISLQHSTAQVQT
jgi:hypothetical protein